MCSKDTPIYKNYEQCYALHPAAKFFIWSGGSKSQLWNTVKDEI